MIEGIIKGYKPLRGVNYSRVNEEISRLGEVIRTPSLWNVGGHRLHKVPVNGEEFIVADAKILNKYTNQSGRGNLRYLFSRQTLDLVGLGYERDNGQYQRVV